MPIFLKIILLTIIGLVSASIGFFGSAAYVGVRGSLEGFADACKMLQVAETKGVLSKDQRATVISDILSKGKDDSKDIQAYLRSDCSQSLWKSLTSDKK